MLIEKNREDVLYGAIRRINYGITQRISLDAPIVGTLICISISLAVVMLIIGLCYTVGLGSIRDQTISTIDEVSLRSQLVSPYDKTRMCVDKRFKPYFD